MEIATAGNPAVKRKPDDQSFKETEFHQTLSDDVLRDFGYAIVWVLDLCRQSAGVVRAFAGRHQFHLYAFPHTTHGVVAQKDVASVPFFRRSVFAAEPCYCFSRNCTRSHRNAFHCDHVASEFYHRQSFFHFLRSQPESA